MRKILYMAFLFFSLQTYSNNLSGYLYKSKVDGKEVSLSYDVGSKSYTFKTRGKSYNYPRSQYQKIEKRHLFDVKSSDFPGLIKNLEKHAQISLLSDPTDEELITYNLKTLEQVNDLLTPFSEACGQNKIARDKAIVKYEKSTNEDHKLIEMTLEDDGFFAMGKLTGVKLELMTSNDNPLHGGLGAIGVTSWGEGIEGDDRGKTFGVSGEVSAEFEKGHLTLRQFSEGYGRLGTADGNSYNYNGKIYKSKLKYDEDGKRYQEFLSIDGLELEVKRELGFDDTYIKVIGRKKEMDDTSGISRSMQESWHDKLSGVKENTVEYRYLDYMEKRKGYEGYVEVGKDFKIYAGPNSNVTSTIYGGVQASTLGSSERFVTIGGEVKAVFLDENSGSVFPKWDVRIYGNVKKYEDRESGVISGISLTRRFAVTEHGYIYIKAGAEYDADRYSKEYGQEEIDRNGRLDIDHKLGIGYEYQLH